MAQRFGENKSISDLIHSRKVIQSLGRAHRFGLFELAESVEFDGVKIDVVT